jgi:UDP-N-acetylmuramoylalanine-D-glutamate ligase
MPAGCRPPVLGAAARPAVPPGPYVVAGLGRAGSAAAFALRRRDPVVVWDGLGRAQERAAATRLAGAGVRSVHAGDGTTLLDGPPLPCALVKSPGLSFDVPLIRAAAARGLPVLDEAELGWRLDTRPLVAVTGTNGKSTTTGLVAALLRGAGLEPVCAGNTRFGVPMCELPGLAGDVVVAELSSFQLEGCPALLPQAAVFTNLTVDHLYRHGTLEAYMACKRRLFLRDGVPVPVAAIGIDQPFGLRLAADVRAAGGTVVTFGADPRADRRVLQVRSSPAGDVVRISERGGARVLRTRLTGVHNALNVAAALALADVLEIDAGCAAEAIAATAPLPGRFERVEGTGELEVFVDFAHNPDGVARAIDAGRARLTGRPRGRLRVVLSALSMVDREQARGMGRAGRAGADQLVLTTQRWTLADQTGALTPGLEEGARELDGGRLDVEPDRRAAIACALKAAVADDVVLILDRSTTAPRRARC